MISDASKLALVGVAATLGILVGFRVSDNIDSTVNSKQHIDTIFMEQRLLREEEKANQLNSESDTGTANVGPEPPKWQLVIEKVGAFLCCMIISECYVIGSVLRCNDTKQSPLVLYYRPILFTLST